MNRMRVVCRGGLVTALVALMALAWVPPLWSKVRPAPEYTARMLDGGEEVTLASLRGQVVLLNTWATWCIPCRQEMPGFEALYRKYRERGFTVVGVNIDEGRADASVERYIEALDVSFPIWRDARNRFSKRFRVLGVPETFLIDRAGRIVHHWRGLMVPDAPQNLALIEAALEVSAQAAQP
ncbi:TlpA disulfide reductase family protein [Nitrococcus mobilis]|uniref:Thioredoxin family protein n=1 Tax=Nitrococcus mobilis Nb-231 TaxID=314278 RepID=A4BVH8_9GAMM|nr:TlpA disulfide reductase family protein [Nitrococcus mobilis]EAR20298.1 thioredoxin family protein [Nitrococcus mobilis Nb-231]